MMQSDLDLHSLSENLGSLRYLLQSHIYQPFPLAFDSSFLFVADGGFLVLSFPSDFDLAVSWSDRKFHIKQ